MRYITEIPNDCDIDEYHLSELLAHRDQTWTVSKTKCSFLILHQEYKDLHYNTREDFYFSFQGAIRLVSFGLILLNDGNCLNFHWYVISTYGSGGTKRLRPVLLEVDEHRHFNGEVYYPSADSVAMLDSLVKAFTAYKTDHGFTENSTQRMFVDYSRVMPDENEPVEVKILPDGRVIR